LVSLPPETFVNNFDGKTWYECTPEERKNRDQVMIEFEKILKKWHF